MAICDRHGLPVAVHVASASPYEPHLVPATLDARFLPDFPSRLIGYRGLAILKPKQLPRLRSRLTAGRFGAGGKAMRMEQLMLTCKELPMVIARETTQAWGRPLVSALAAAWVFSIAPMSLALGQASSRPCPPASERTDEPRPTCSTGSEKLGQLSDGPLFWHLDVYPTRAAAETAKGPRGTVIESLGKVWLFTIAETNWHPPDGVRIAKIGPLPVTPNVKYTAVYWRAFSIPGQRPRSTCTRVQKPSTRSPATHVWRPPK